MELTITDFSSKCKAYEFSNPLHLFCQNKFYATFSNCTLFLSKLEKCITSHNLTKSNVVVPFFHKHMFNKYELQIKVPNDLNYCSEENIFPNLCKFGFDKIKIDLYNLSRPAEAVNLIIKMSANFKDLPIYISGVSKSDIISLLMRDRKYSYYNNGEIICGKDDDQLFRDILKVIVENAEEKITTKFTFKNEIIF